MRGITGEGEEQQGRGSEDPADAAVGERADVRGRRIGGERGGDDDGERPEHDGDDDAGEPRRLLHAEQVDGGQRDHRADPERAGQVGVDVGTEGQRHGRAAGGLADHEPPSGEEPPQVAQPLAPVDVGAARRRVERGELRGRRGVAVRHTRGQSQTDEQPTAGGRGGRADRGEDAGADHRPEADDDRVEGAEPTRGSRLGGSDRDGRQPAGWKSSIRLPEGSSMRICEPPGPVTTSLRNGTPSAAQPIDLAGEVVEDEVDPVPPAGRRAGRRRASAGRRSSGGR